MDKVFYHSSEAMPELPNESVQCCVTSPPYFRLRDYGVEGQIGMEPTVEDYVERLVGVFREVRRVLRPDGLLWLNIGDCYLKDRRRSRSGLEPGNLIGVPWRVAFALQRDGWILRQDIIYAKKTAMPEPVTNRCTRAHEFIFMFARSNRYYYNAAAITEPSRTLARHPGLVKIESRKQKTISHDKSVRLTAPTAAGRALEDPDFWRRVASRGVNRRSVWFMSGSYKGAHFAVFPPMLPRLCIAASTKPGDLVLDPFIGSGTTACAAIELGRHYVGYELNEGYRSLIEQRIAETQVPMFAPGVGLT